MAKWRLYIRETRHSIIEIEADTPEQGMQAFVAGLAKPEKHAGIIEGTLDKWENLTAQPDKKIPEKFNPLDKTHTMN